MMDSVSRSSIAYLEPIITACNSYSYLGPRELEQMPGNCTDIVGHVWVLSKETSYDEMMRVFKTVKYISPSKRERNGVQEHLRLRQYPEYKLR